MLAFPCGAIFSFPERGYEKGWAILVVDLEYVGLITLTGAEALRFGTV